MLYGWHRYVKAKIISMSKKVHPDNLEKEDRLWLMEIMRELRKELWLSQEELAESLGIQQSALSRIESGRGNPSYITLMKIARMANKKIDFV